MRTYRWIVALLLVTTLNCVAGFFDGSKWKIKITPAKAATEKGEKAFDDTLSLTNGNLSSVTFAAKGFEPGRCRGEQEKNDAEFEVEQISPTDGKLNWLGVIRGKRINGQVKWTKKDGMKFIYNFEGVPE